MKGLRKQRRIQIVALAGVCLLGVLAVLWFLPKDAFQFFRSPSEVLAAPPAEDEFFQLGGLVKEGSMTPVEGVAFGFVITDGGSEVPVRYVGNDPAPDLFGEGQGTIVKGYFVDGVFQASELLAKHDETYMPAEVIDVLKEQGVYKDPNG
ncbi:MAG: cytochrome c maturation protein CcmE [Paracoccaceae bacterium]|nr:cytochrome c maturation protein CcmE [Paracoccaceae bacterium]